jgi:hypothetical protein
MNPVTARTLFVGCPSPVHSTSSESSAGTIDMITAVRGRRTRPSRGATSAPTAAPP